MTINALFAFAVVEGSVIKIPKAALPGLSNPATVTAGQFFGSVLLRGMDYYPQAPTWQDSHKVSITNTFSCYADIAQNRLVGNFRTEIEFLTTNLESL